MKQLRILFISRAFPPTVGGIENQNYELSVWLSKIAEVRTIANRRGKNFLPFFLPYAAIKTLFLSRYYDAVLLGDGVLSVIGFKLKFFSKKPVVCITHGLDLTYRFWFYQKLWIGFFLKKLDKLIAVGNETVRVAVKKGIAQEKIVFIPNGVDISKFYKPTPRLDLEKFLGENLAGRKVILTSGRLAKRKGVSWFISEVLPKLSESILYVVAGDGPDKENIKTAIKKSGLSSRIKMLGYIKDEDRDLLFNTCDVFAQPNIKVEGDMEGFGISVIEAASCKIPVIAADLEGLRDAIKDGQNGFLVESGNADAWVGKINEVLADDTFRREFGVKARNYVLENYSWEKISMRYLEEIGITVKTN